MMWKIPLMVSLLMAGEFSIIALWKSYRNLLTEWQKSHVREEQLKQMKKRFEEVDTFYGDIRKVRHEMRNHMTNIKGLIATEKYNEVDSYIEKLDDTIQGLEIENYYDGELVWNEEKKLPVSTKENGKTQEAFPTHGLGLKNVAEIADQYLGGMQIEADNHVFRVVVMLQKR